MARARTALVVLPILLSALVYLPILRTYFFADDFVCLYQIANTGFVKFFLQPFGGHVLLVRNLAFYLFYHLFGPWSEAFYSMVLLTHLLNVWLLFRIVRAFTGSDVLAAFGATAWGTSPLNVGTLAWYSVYGQVLVATALLLALDGVARHWRDGTAPSAGAVLGWSAIMVAGATCFGVGIGTAMVFPIAVFLLLPSTRGRGAARWILLSLPVVTGALYVAFGYLYAVYVDHQLDEMFLMHTFFKPPAIFRMVRHLLEFGSTRLALGFAGVHVPYPGLLTNLVAACAGAALLAVAVTGDARTRRLLLALALVAVAAYGIIALGRSNVYLMFKQPATVAAATPRYHYVGALPLVLLGCVVLGRLADWRRIRSIPALPVLALWLAIQAVGYASAGLTIDDRRLERDYVTKTLSAVDAAAAVGTTEDAVYVRNVPAPRWMLGPVFRHPQFPGSAALFVITHRGNVVHGRRVYFIEQDPEVLLQARLHAGSRLADLLVGPEDLEDASRHG
jgi:hypothetical protein